MDIISDIFRRSIYLSIFIIPIPIGAYTIHNGSSAAVALISYLALAFLIPFFYLRSEKSGFGEKKRRIKPVLYIISFAIIEALTYLVFSHIDLEFLWNLPTIGRDFAFGIVMYFQVSFALIIASIFQTFMKESSSCTVSPDSLV